MPNTAMPSTMTSSTAGRPVLVLGEFETPESLMDAADRVRSAGFVHWDCYTPYPVHGLDAKMGVKPTALPCVVLGGGLILFSAFGAFFGMLAMNGLPRFYRPHFRSERFRRVTDDRFFIGIEARDRSFDPARNRELLSSLGASHVEVIEE